MIDTPTAIVDLDRIRSSVSVVQRAHPGLRPTYAMKASYHRPILDAVRLEGAGISVFSEQELELARRAGFASSDIVYNGVGREGEALVAALDEGVVVNVESLAELDSLLEAHRANPISRRVGIRLNVNDIVAGFPREKYDVLGIRPSELPRVADSLIDAGVIISGVSFHCLANRRDLDQHRSIVEELVPSLLNIASHPAVSLEYVDVGGGLAPRVDVSTHRVQGMLYDLAEFIAENLDCTTIVEFGRFFVSDAESVVSRAVDVRHTGEAPVVILDAATNYLIPAPGHDFHVRRLFPSGEVGALRSTRFIDRLGSLVCEGLSEPVARGDLVVVLNAGAYAAVMKEHFVYALPSVLFLEGGTVSSSLPAGSIESVLVHHGWPQS